MREVGGLPWVFRFPPPIKLTVKILLIESGAKHHFPNPKKK